MNKRLLLALSAVLLLALSLLSLSLGSVRMGIDELLRAALSGAKGTDGFIFYYSRLPRTVGCIAAGFALSLSGAVLQSVLGNRLAAPGIIGVNSGAGLAVAVASAMGLASGWVFSAASFMGALAASLAILVISSRIRTSRSSLLLAGVSLNYILGAFSDIVVSLFPEASMASGDFKVGGFASISAIRLYPAAALIALASIAVIALGNELEVLSLGDEEARSLGMNASGMRILFVVLASMLAGAAVSFSGLLGFAGLIIPNAVRRMLRGDNRLLLPLSGMLGGCFVTLCDTLARILFRPYEIPCGIILALIGGPVFLYLVLRRDQ
ncbi:MAG: iron ABC transporter permease [Candidatus Ornithospirochaeta sp.]|nr:iron ABC transporter permease [Candidatus Ornithospirochaeta sp.]